MQIIFIQMNHGGVSSIMKRILLMAIVLILVGTTAGVCESGWIIADSDTRALTQEELWQWDCESLEYIKNEIYARHGYHFREGSAYAEYFTQKDWYTPHPRGNTKGAQAELTDVELQNIRLITQVQQQMLSQGMLNRTEGQSFRDAVPTVPPLSFVLAELRGGQKAAVYSAPSTKAWRGAKSKAEVSTNGEVWVAGKVDNWVLICYETSKGSVRIGYVDSAKLKDDLSGLQELAFAGREATITAGCSMTDDVTRQASSIVKLKAGATVTYLAPYERDGVAWAYIETKASNKTARGFIPADCLSLAAD